VLLIALVTVGLIVAPAEADECNGAPQGTVTLTQSGANVDVTVAPSSFFRFVKTGAGDFQYFKFNISGTYDSIAVDQTVAGKTLTAQSGAFDGGGNGDFEFGITCPTCRKGKAGALPVGTQIMFHVVGATIAQLTEPNDLGEIFVASLLCISDGTSGAVEFTVP
jgi:hypothetical protein